MTGLQAPQGWRPCHRYACSDLPLHEHVLVPFRPELVTHPWSATHLEGPDIARVYVDWRTVAYEQWTGRRLLPPEGEQLTLVDVEEPARG